MPLNISKENLFAQAASADPNINGALKKIGDVAARTIILLIDNNLEDYPNKPFITNPKRLFIINQNNGGMVYISHLDENLETIPKTTRRFGNGYKVLPLEAKLF